MIEVKEKINKFFLGPMPTTTGGYVFFHAALALMFGVIFAAGFYILCLAYAFSVWEPVVIWWQGVRVAFLLGIVAAVWGIIVDATDD